MEEEFLKDPNSWQAKMTIAQGDEEMVLHFSEYLKPVVYVILVDVCLSASIKNLDMGPLERLELLLLDDFLEGLADEKSIPLLWCSVGPIFFSVRATDVDLFFSAWKRVHLQGGRPDILRASQKNL